MRDTPRHGEGKKKTRGGGGESGGDTSPWASWEASSGNSGGGNSGGGNSGSGGGGGGGGGDGDDYLSWAGSSVQQETLPKGWKATKDRHGRTFFYNRKQNIKQYR